MNENSVKKCRTCLKNSTRTFPLAKLAIGSNPKATYSRLLQDYANLECPTDYEHLMPQSLCVLCCRELGNACHFIRQAQYCNNKLLNLIAKQLPSLQEKAIVLPNNEIEFDKSVGIILKKDDNDSDTSNCRPLKNTMNEFRIVNTSVILKSEVLDETTENCGPIRSYIDETRIDEKSTTTSSTITTAINGTDNGVFSNYQTEINCPICKKTISGRNNLITHMRIQHDIEVPNKFLNTQMSEQNMNNVKRDKYDIIVRAANQQSKHKVIKCRLCNYAARTYSALDFHNRSKHGTEKDKFKCKFCPYMSLKKFSLLKHVKKSHIELIKTLKNDAENKMDQRETVDDIDNTANGKFATAETNQNENSSSSYVAPLKQDITASSLNSEIENDEEELSDEMFIRNILNIKKRQSKTLSNKSLPRRCDECGNIYNNFRALKTHQQNVHISEEKYSVCQQCGKRFKRRANLRIHIKNAHVSKKSTEIIKQTASKEKEKRFMCAECSYVCGTITSLTIHINRHHTGEKPYKCDICCKSFIVSHDLKIHRYLHTGERPYKCPICSKGFRCSSQLIKHKRIHNNERPYKCKDCGKSFTQSYNLSLHKRTHLKKKHLNCSICDKLFENESLLNMHRYNENHHDEVV